MPCGLQNVVFDWDFTMGDHGFTTQSCDEMGGAPLWEHGATTYIPDVPGTVWGTILEGDYITDGGDALVTPTFMVDASTPLMEVEHYYSAENLWDGGNVTVNGNAIEPLVGYPGVINVPGDWYAWCVDFEWGFTGVDSGWLTSCFDLTPYMGQEVSVAFEFGSDDAYTEAGWYIASVKVGNADAVAAEGQTFSEIKALFR